MNCDDLYENQILSLDTEQHLSYSQAMIRGAALAMEHCLHDADAYHDLLEEELEGSSSAGKYLDQCRNLSRQMKNLVTAVSHGMNYEDTSERLGLKSVVCGVVSRYQKIMNDNQKIVMDIDDNLFIRGNVYQLQEMFFRYLDSGIVNQKSWCISGHAVSISQVEMKQMHSRLSPGNYAMFSVSHEHLLSEIPSGFQDISENWSNRSVSEKRMKQLLYWSGVAATYSGCVLEGREGDNDPDIILLLPLAEAWNESSESHMDFRNNDGQKTILLVDDEDMIWDVINDMLQDMGYQVILAGNGLEAVEIYENNPGAIDLVLLDMIMPEMSGKEAFARLKEIDPDVRVLLSSGYVSGEEVADVLNAGARGFLKKPYRMTDLARKIQEII